jgi:hypothetical protein
LWATHKKLTSIDNRTRTVEVAALMYLVPIVLGVFGGMAVLGANR